jgi:hypothetical protein
MAKLNKNKLMDLYRKESLGRGVIGMLTSKRASESLCALIQNHARIADAPFVFTIEKGKLRKTSLPKEDRASVVKALSACVDSDFSGRVVVDGWNDHTTARLYTEPRLVL